MRGCQHHGCVFAIVDRWPERHDLQALEFEAQFLCGVVPHLKLDAEAVKVTVSKEVQLGHSIPLYQCDAPAKPSRRFRLVGAKSLEPRPQRARREEEAGECPPPP